MMRSRLRYLLHTSRGPVGAAPIAATIGYAVISRLAWWRGDWQWGYHHLGQTVPVLMLVTAFVSGWDSGSPSSGYGALVERIPASRLRVVATVLSVPLGLAVGLFAVGVALVAAATWSGDGVVDPRAALLIGSHLLMICVAAAVGLQVGRVLASPYASFASAAIVGIALFVHVGNGQHVFELAGTAGPAAGITQAPLYFAENLVTLLVVSLALIAPLALRRTSRAGVGAGVAVAVAAFSVTSLAGSTEQFVASPHGPTRCAGTEVEVCVYPGYDRLLPVITGRLDGFLDEAASKGVPSSAFPARLLQLDVGSPGPKIGPLEIGSSALRDANFDSLALAVSLSSPTWCPALFGSEPPSGLLTRRDLVFEWIQYVDGGLSKDELAAVQPRFARLTPSRQAALIIDTMQQLRRCDNS